jgi:hypothetical protein
MFLEVEFFLFLHFIVFFLLVEEFHFVHVMLELGLFVEPLLDFVGVVQFGRFEKALQVGICEHLLFELVFEFFYFHFVLENDTGNFLLFLLVYREDYVVKGDLLFRNLNLFVVVDLLKLLEDSV